MVSVSVYPNSVVVMGKVPLAQTLIVLCQVERTLFTIYEVVSSVGPQVGLIVIVLRGSTLICMSDIVSIHLFGLNLNFTS